VATPERRRIHRYARLLRREGLGTEQIATKLNIAKSRVEKLAPARARGRATPGHRLRPRGLLRQKPTRPDHGRDPGLNTAASMTARRSPRSGHQTGRRSRDDDARFANVLQSPPANSQDRHRWVVERTFAWLHNRRRVLLRTDLATTFTKASSAVSLFGGSATRILRRGPAERNMVTRAREQV
jgi:hypothetical protein